MPVIAVDLAARPHSIAAAHATFEAAVDGAFEVAAADSEGAVAEAVAAEGDAPTSGSSTISSFLAGFRTEWASIGLRTMEAKNSMSV